MYSPFKTALQFLHLKHHMCHCRSKAINAWPSFNWSPQPAHSFGSYSPAFSLRCTDSVWLCCWAVALVGLLAISLIGDDVFCTCGADDGWILLFGMETHFSHSTSLPVFVTCSITIRDYNLQFKCGTLKFKFNFYLATRLKWLLTSTACKTSLMVCITHSRYNLTLNILLACGTFSSIQFLIIRCTIICIVFGKETTGC